MEMDEEESNEEVELPTRTKSIIIKNKSLAWPWMRYFGVGASK